MIWFDTHAHLQDEVFAEDWQLVLERAADQGVGRILLPSSDLEDSAQAVALASRDSRFCCAIGCHPHAASGFDRAAMEQLEQMIAANCGNPIVALGEIGLDYHYDLSPRPIQQAVFETQLDLAFECGLPLIIHEREAVGDCLRILQEKAEAGKLRPVPGVFHCYSGSPETAAILLKMGFYLGVDGPVTFNNVRKIPEVLKICPQERLLLETDSPYLTPVPYRGQRNEPSFLPLIAAKVAEIWQIPLADLARITTENACRLFGLPLPAQ